MGRLQGGLLQQFSELQQGFARAARIDAERQTFDAMPLGHPKRNGKSSMLELDFEMLPAIEPMRAEDIQFLLMERMEGVEHRNFTRIAGIIAAGLSARLTIIGKFLSAARLTCGTRLPSVDSFIYAPRSCYGRICNSDQH